VPPPHHVTEHVTSWQRQQALYKGALQPGVVAGDPPFSLPPPPNSDATSPPAAPLGSPPQQQQQSPSPPLRVVLAAQRSANAAARQRARADMLRHHAVPSGDGLATLVPGVSQTFDWREGRHLPSAPQASADTDDRMGSVSEVGWLEGQTSIAPEDTGGFCQVAGGGSGIAGVTRDELSVAMADVTNTSSVLEHCSAGDRMLTVHASRYGARDSGVVLSATCHCGKGGCALNTFCTATNANANNRHAGRRTNDSSKVATATTGLHREQQHSRHRLPPAMHDRLRRRVRS
jgi:hypothetical protein